MNISKQVEVQTAITQKPFISAVDLFCGAGGLTHGLERSGVLVKLGVDIDPACEYPYEANNKAAFMLKGVEEVEGEDILKTFANDDITLLAGCAPCQTFSTYNQKANSSDKRWWLLGHFSRLIKESQPTLVTMENVPGLIDQDVFKNFVEELEKQNYHVSYQVVNCAEYGLPQHRNRLVLLASKLDAIKLIPPQVYGAKKQTVRDVIGLLPTIRAGETHSEDPLHRSSGLSELNYKRIRASKPGGSWRDWPEELIAPCHKRQSGKTYGSVYGRMDWDKPAPTMTTQFFGFGNGRFGHPEQDRGISLREGAVFQGFPEDYKFFKGKTMTSKTAIGRLIGNAVPVTLGEVIGKSLMRHVRRSM